MRYFLEPSVNDVVVGALCGLAALSFAAACKAPRVMNFALDESDGSGRTGSGRAEEGGAARPDAAGWSGSGRRGGCGNEA